MAKTVLVFGASGTIGQGFIKASLEKGDVKVVGIFRSEESVKKVGERLGNPAEDKYVTVVGSVASEKDAADLQKRVLEKIGSYTDVVATVGGFSFAKTLLEFSAEEIRTIVSTDKVEPHFLIAKYFMLPIQDKEGTSFTIINGSAAYQPYPNFGHMTISNGALKKLAQVIMVEHKDKPIRINEFVIGCFVTPWDNPTVPPGLSFSMTDNVTMGKGLLGVIVHPNSKSVVLDVTVENVVKLAQDGTL